MRGLIFVLSILSVLLWWWTVGDTESTYRSSADPLEATIMIDRPATATFAEAVTRREAREPSVLHVKDEAERTVNGANVLSDHGDLVGQTDASGLCPLNAATRCVKIVHPAYASQIVRWADGCKPGTTTVILKLGMKVRGQVVDQDGIPLGDTRVVLSRFGANSASRGSENLLATSLALGTDGTQLVYAVDTVTTADGRFSMESLHDGPHHLDAHRFGYICVQQQGVGSSGVVVRPSMDPEYQEVRLSRVYLATCRLAHGDVPVAYVQSCLSLAYGYPKGLTRLRHTELDRTAVRRQLGRNAEPDNILFLGLSHAVKDSNLVGSLRGSVTAGVLGSSLGSHDLVFVPLDQWNSGVATDISIPVPPAEQVIIDAALPAVLRTDDRVRHMFLPVATEGEFTTFLVPKGAYVIEPAIDAFLGRKYVRHRITVPSAVSIERPTFEAVGRMVIEVVDGTGAPSHQGMIVVRSSKTQFLITPEKLRAARSIIPAEGGNYEISLLMADRSVVDRQQIDVAEGATSTVRLQWK